MQVLVSANLLTASTAMSAGCRFNIQYAITAIVRDVVIAVVALTVAGTVVRIATVATVEHKNSGGCI
jgi:hypothetical protein